ncbi:NAC domain-containing protein 104 [Ziziphus jujuba]|uniref:NAC domain-containing protein 104 n=1 Tax=Ziziphus jujuba TaxID=326968 RepID=A0A6P4AYH1_ZIZJJ|nr:NAC domain-containing protein 104 [Ziziphus jujuba]
MGDGNMMISLPPGFQFCPTDQELVLHFLYRKALLLPCHPTIPDLNLHLYNPWEFNGRALLSGNIYYFFSKVKENRTTKNGYWKESDVDEVPIQASHGEKVGVKKFLVFCLGVPPTGNKTSWVMEEYKICNTSGFSAAVYKKRGKQKLNCNKWVLCRVHERKGILSEQHTLCYGDDDDDNGTELSCLDEMFLSLDDDLEEISLQTD